MSLTTYSLPKVTLCFCHLCMWTHCMLWQDVVGLLGYMYLPKVMPALTQLSFNLSRGYGLLPLIGDNYTHFILLVFMVPLRLLAFRMHLGLIHLKITPLLDCSHSSLTCYRHLSKVIATSLDPYIYSYNLHHIRSSILHHLLL